MTDAEKIQALCDALEPFAAAEDQMTPVGAKVESSLGLLFSAELDGVRQNYVLPAELFSIPREAVHNAYLLLRQIKEKQEL